MKYRLLQRGLLGASLVLAALLALAGCAAATGPAAGGPVVDPGTSASVDVPAAKAADDLVDTGVYKGVYSYQDATDTLVHGSLVFSVTSGATLQKAVSTDRSVWVFEKTQDTTIKYTGSVTTDASGFTATFKPKTDTVIVLTVPFSPTLGNPPTLSYKKGGVALPTTVLKETSTAKVLTFNGSYSGGGGTAPANWKVSGSWDLLIQGTVVTGNYHGAVKAGTQSLPDTGSVSGTLSGTKITLSGTGPMGNGSGTITTSGISGTWTSSGTNPGSGTWSGSATFNAPVTPTLAGTAVTGVSVSSSTLTLTAGGTSSTLTATVVPAGASNPDVFWSSSNPAVATVSSTGVVTPLVAGTATITATTADGAKTATTTVTVGSGTTPVTPVAVTGVSVTPSTLTLTAGGATGTLTAAVAPTNAANPAVTWSSSNTAIATVSSTGVVTPVAAGTTTITATTSDGAKTASATVTVEAGSTPVTPVAVTGVTVSPTTLSLTAGGSVGTLTATIAPSNATNTAVTWSSSNTATATVSASGVVTPVAAGTATITVTTSSGSKKAYATVTVAAVAPTAPTGVTVAAEQGTCAVSWSPVPTATSYNLYWSTSSNLTVATATKITGVTSPYTHTGRTNGTTYYYLVTALNSGVESPASAVASGLPKLPPPAAPTGITIYGSNTATNITWPSVAGATSYNLYWSTSSSVSTSSLNQLTKVTSPYTHTKRTNGATYYYVLTAVGAGGESLGSETFSAAAVAPTHTITATTGGTWVNGTLKGTITINSGSPISSYTVSYGLSTLLGDALVDGNYLWRSTVIKNLSDPYTCVWLKVKATTSSAFYYVLLDPTIPSQGVSSYNVTGSPWWYETFATSYNGNVGSGYLSETAAIAFWKAGFTVVDAFLTPMP